MNLYKYLKETAILDQLKQTMLPNFHKLQDLITEYIVVDDPNNALILLDRMIDLLTSIIEELENLGYDYEPDSVPDEDEETFKDILDKYKEQLSYFYNNFSEELFEPFNVQTRYIQNLIEVHKTNFKE